MIEFDYTLQVVALGAAVLGITSGALGTFAVLRGQSLLGDAISHAALPGVVIAFIVMGTKAPLGLALGAGIAGWLGALAVGSVVRRSRIPLDAALGIVLAVFFGLGLVALTFAQRIPGLNSAGLNAYLFGQAAALVAADVWLMAALGALALGTMAVFWKELKVLLFDPDFAASVGYPVRRLDVLLTTLLVIAIVVGLQTVGVVLMSAMLIAPAAAARQWTNTLSGVVGLAALFGAASGVSGALLSATVAQLPTGPTIVLCASGIVLVSLLAAPGRGLVARWIQTLRSRRTLESTGVLEDLYTLALHHGDLAKAHPAATLKTMTARPERVDPTLSALESRGWVRPSGEDGWALTDAGQAYVRRLARNEQTDPSE
ncbi:metal ABC transporter permease [Rubricoccus marinus]|uniref:ABC transporter n=1 Tax=Rubricoccus marinus TaxID=716817 RepID=A0A259U2G8_9BACT|nr:metal ABC transporter permease [Rubricoccus marinus]OZC04172.1 ABC transporter [Rubricoccus marinus]